MMCEARPDLVVFDSDAYVREILAGDRQVADEVRAVFGERAIGADGGVDRAVVRELVFADPELRRQLEQILHPRVREECLARRRNADMSSAAAFVADIPLFYESDHPIGQDLVLVVAVAVETQIQRLIARNGFDLEMIHAILAAQRPLPEKIRLADIIFWNEGPCDVLARQIRRFFLPISSLVSRST